MPLEVNRQATLEYYLRFSLRPFFSPPLSVRVFCMQLYYLFCRRNGMKIFSLFDIVALFLKIFMINFFV